MTEDAKPRYRRVADGRTFRIADGYKNVVAALGTSRDKAAFGAYQLPVFTSAELLEIFRASWIARRIVTIPSLDAMRKGREWQADPDVITKLEKAEKRLNFRKKIISAMNASRLFGRGACYMSVGKKGQDIDPLEAIDIESVGVGDLRSLVLLSESQIQAGPMCDDPNDELYGTPQFYWVGMNGVMQPTHPSRLVMFRGAEVPDGWRYGLDHGDSVLQSTYDAVRQSDATMANIASLVFEAKVDTIHIPGLMDLVRDPVSEERVLARLALGTRAKGNNGTLILDGGKKNKDGEVVGKEDYNQKNITFGSLPDLVDRFFLNVCGAAEIPITRFFGRSAAGLSGSGDGDERVYYDRINSIQELELEPALAIFDEVLIRSELGDRPEEIHYNWRPLRQMTEKERADVFNTTATAARTLAGSSAGNLLPMQALSEALANELIEQGALPGLEQAIEDAGGIEGEEPTEEEANAALAVGQPLEEEEVPERGVVRQLTRAEINRRQAEKVKAGDAGEEYSVPLYVSRKVTNASEIIAWAKAQGFKSTLPASDLHVTVCYSKTPVDMFAIGETWEEEVTIAAGGPRAVAEFNGGAIVLRFSSRSLKWRHEEMKEHGASWDHEGYSPHITISYGELPENVKPYTGKIVLGPEIFEEINPNWKEELVEE